MYRRKRKILISSIGPNVRYKSDNGQNGDSQQHKHPNLRIDDLLRTRRRIYTASPSQHSRIAFQHEVSPNDPQISTAMLQYLEEMLSDFQAHLPH